MPNISRFTLLSLLFYKKNFINIFSKINFFFMNNIFKVGDYIINVRQF